MGAEQRLGSVKCQVSLFILSRNMYLDCFLHRKNRFCEFYRKPLASVIPEKYCRIYSLYSTATQNTWRRGLALGNAPNTRILRWRYQHVGIFWRYLTLKIASPSTPTPDASQWNIGGVGSQTQISWVGHVHFFFFV